MKINKLIITIIAAAFIFMGCSNSLDSTPSAAGRYSVTGKISFAGSSGAAPLILTKDSEGRTATTSFNNAHFSLNLYAYKYDEQAKDFDLNNKYDNVVVDQSGSFIFCFESKGEYVIYAELIKDEKTCGKGSAYVDVNSFTPKSVRINASPVITEDGKIQLAVSAATDTDPQIKKVCVSWIRSFGGRAEDDVGGNNESSDLEAAMERRNAVESGEYNKSFDLVNGTATISYDDFPGGSWLAKISFDDENGNSLYSCQEIINVYPTFTTNIWYGSSPALTDGTFKITKNMVTNYGTECVPNTDYVLYTNESGNYQYYLKTSPAESVSGSADISTYTSGFCFDANGNFYYLTQNGANYVFNNNTETLGEFAPKNSNIPSIIVDFATNIMYSWCLNESQILISKYSNLISNGDISETTEFEINSPTISVDGDTISPWPDICTIYNGIAYVIARDSSSHETGSYICKAPLQGQNYSLTDSDCVNLKLNENGLSNARIQDLIYQDGSIYMLYKEDGTYISRGAVLRYNTSTGYIDSLGLAGAIDNDSITGVKVSTYVWDSVNEINKPLYNDEDCTNRWYVDADKVWFSTEIYSPNSFESLSTSQFYGPSKFVAIKPKKLVIADDGIAFYTDNDVLKYKNVNRVVTVDLEQFAIENTEDTSVIFDSDKSGMIDIGSTAGLTVYQDAVADEVDVDHKKYYGSNTNEYLTSVASDTIVFAIPCGD